MEYWGVEVRPREEKKVKFKKGKLIHLSHATFQGVVGENVGLYLKVDGEEQQLLGNLLHGEFLSFDLVFQKKFELSHTRGNGSVYFSGVTYPDIMEDEPETETDDDDDDDDDDDVSHKPATDVSHG